MASGDTLFILKAQDGVPTATLGAVPGIFTGGSTPAEAVPVLRFIKDAVTYSDFIVEMPAHYGGGGLTCVVKHVNPSATGGIRYGLAFRLCDDDAEALSASHTYDFNDASDTTLPTANRPGYLTITFADSADADGVVAGKLAVLRVRREGTHADDTLDDWSNLISIHVSET